MVKTQLSSSQKPKKRKNLWRQFEDATIDTRLEMLGECFWKFSIDIPEELRDDQSESMAPNGKWLSVGKNGNYSTITEAVEHNKIWLLDLINKMEDDIKKYQQPHEYDQTAIIQNRRDLSAFYKKIYSLICQPDMKYEWERKPQHSPTYKKLVGSFYRSEEWKQFTASWLETHPLCDACGRSKEVMNVHHKNSLFNTIISEGFLKPLEDPDRFVTLCQRCHAIEGGYIQILSIEDFLKNPYLENYAGPNKNTVEIHPPEGYTGIIKMSQPETYLTPIEERKKLIKNMKWPFPDPKPEPRLIFPISVKVHTNYPLDKDEKLKALVKTLEGTPREEKPEKKPEENPVKKKSWWRFW